VKGLQPGFYKRTRLKHWQQINRQVAGFDAELKLNQKKTEEELLLERGVIDEEVLFRAKAGVATSVRIINIASIFFIGIHLN